MLPEAVLAGREPALVFVLFTDVVGGSGAANDDQARVNERLTALVKRLPQFQDAQARGELISLPTGDGMALVFFGQRVDAPLRCAIEIARTLKTDPFCKLRMGIHSGLVLVSPDINGKPNVNGEGINLAERVMSCGGDGHILISDALAERLKGMSEWRGKLHFLGEFVAKKDTPRVWSFVDGDIGSRAPLKAISKKARSRRRAFGATLAAVALAAAGLLWWQQSGVNLPVRSLTYSWMVEDESGAVRPVETTDVLPAGAKMRLRFSSPESGFLYVIAEGASTSNWLFPGPGYMGGPGEVQIHLAPGAGRETVHLLWTETRINEAEAIKDALIYRRSGGELSSGEAATMAHLMSSAAAGTDQKNPDRSHTVTARGPAMTTSFTVDRQ